MYVHNLYITLDLKSGKPSDIFRNEENCIKQRHLVLKYFNSVKDLRKQELVKRDIRKVNNGDLTDDYHLYIQVCIYS